MGENVDPATIAELQAMQLQGAQGQVPQRDPVRRPGKSAVPQNIIAELSRVEAAGMSAVDTSSVGYMAKIALANAQTAHERGFTDHLANAGKSLVGAFASIAPDILQFAGAASSYLGAQNVGEAVQQSGAYLAREIDETFGVEDPTLVDKFASAAGFMAGLLIPGAKAAKAGQLVARGAPRAFQALSGALLGGAAAASLEAAAEAGDQVERKVRDGMDPDQAFEEAWRAFGPNIAGSVITNLPLFSGMGRIAKASVEALTEGGQEMYQGWLDQWVMDGAEGGFARGFGKTVQENWDTQWEAGGIGATVGFVAGLILGRKTGRSFDDSLKEKGGDEAGRRVAKLRDDAAEMSDEDLIQAISQIQAEALGGAVAPQAIEHYGVLMEEASYRLGDQAIRAQSTSALKDAARYFEQNAENLNPSQQGVYAFTVTELYARGEISKAEAAIHIQKVGIPEGRVDLDKIETRETQQAAVRVKPLRGRWVVENMDTGEPLASFDDHADAVMHMEGLQRGSVAHGGAEAARRSPVQRGPGAPATRGEPEVEPPGATDVSAPGSSGSLTGDLRHLAKLGDLIHSFPNPRVGHLLWRNPDGTWSVVNATEDGPVGGVFETQEEAIEAVQNEPYFIPNERWMDYYNNLWKPQVGEGQGRTAQEGGTDIEGGAGGVQVAEEAQATEGTQGATEREGRGVREVEGPPARRQLQAPRPGQQTASAEAREARAELTIQAKGKMGRGQNLNKQEARAILREALDSTTPTRVIDYILDQLTGRVRGRASIDPYEVEKIAQRNYSSLPALNPTGTSASRMAQTWGETPLSELRRINSKASSDIEQNVRDQGGKAAARFFTGQDGNSLPSSVSSELYAAWEMSMAELNRRGVGPLDDIPFFREPRAEPTQAMDGRDVTLGTMFGGGQDILASAARRAASASKKAVLKAEKAFAGRELARRPDDGPAMTEALDLLVQARKNAARRAAMSEKWRLGYWDKLYKTHVDDLHGLKVALDKGFREVGLPTIDEMPMLESAYHSLRGVVRSWNAFADRFVQGGVRKFTNPDEKLSERGLGQIMNDEKYEIADNYDQFGEYLKAKRFVAMGKEPRYADRLGTPEAQKRLRMSRAVVAESEAKHPTWAEAAGELHDYANGLLDYLVDTEMMTADEAARIKESADFYVPMNIAPDLRNPGAFSTTPGKGLLQHKPVNEFTRLVEGHEISHPLESLASATYQMVNAAHMNMGRRRAAQAVAEITEIDPELVPYMGEILTVDDFRRPLTRTRAELEAAAGTRRRRKSAVRQKLREWEVDEDTIQEVLEAFDEAGDMIGHQHKKLWYVQLELKKDMVAYFDQGEFKILKMNNPDMYEAFHALTEKQHNAVLAMTGKLTRMLRSGVVLGPEFAIRNPIRDIFSSAVLAGKAVRAPMDAIKFLGHWGKGLAAAIQQNELYDQWVMSGGANADLVALDRETMGLRVRRQLLRGRKGGFAKFLAQHPLTAMRAFSGMTEAATRVAVFRAELKANLADGLPMREAQIRAGMESREASVDFSRRGDFGATMNQLQPFYNAALQGTDKLVRALARGTPAQRRAAAIRATMLVTVPSLIHAAMFGDEEWHKRLPRYQKNMYWNFNLDGSNPHGRILRIPKPFELGMIFGALPERLIEYARKNDPHAIDGWLSQFVDVTAPLKLSEVVPPVVAFYNASRNWDDFRNSEIVKGQLQKLPGSLQYTPSTSAAARAMSAALPGDIAPLKIDFYVRSAFGGVGQIAADIASAGVSLVKPSLAEHRMGGQAVAGPITDSWPVVRGFIEAGPHAFDTNSQDFYGYLDEATTAHTLYSRAKNGLVPPDVMAKELSGRLHWLALYKPLAQMSRDVSKLTGGIKLLQAMPDAALSDEEKREKIDAMIKARAQLYQTSAEMTRKILYDEELMGQFKESGQTMVEKITE